jgi:hypothetical protein
MVSNRQTGYAQGHGNPVCGLTGLASQTSKVDSLWSSDRAQASDDRSGCGKDLGKTCNADLMRGRRSTSEGYHSANGAESNSHGKPGGGGAIGGLEKSRAAG